MYCPFWIHEERAGNFYTAQDSMDAPFHTSYPRNPHKECGVCEACTQGDDPGDESLREAPSGSREAP